MSTEFKIYCGTDTNGNEGVDAKGYALNLAAEHFPLGHTITEELGRWTTADGVIVTEPTIVITWIASAEQVQTGEAHGKVSRCASDFKFFCYQESVLITRREIDAVFI